MGMNENIKETMRHIYSKMLPIVTGVIFVMVLVFSFCAKPETAVDASIYVTAISIAGGIWGSSIIWYSKKRTRETAYELRIKLYHESVKSRLYFNKEMIKLMSKYHLTENDLAKIDNWGETDEMMQSAIDAAVEIADATQSEADEPDQMENFG